MTFERTSDMALVRSIICHPKVWPWVTDDLSPAIEVFEPTEHPAIWYMLAWDEKERHGLAQEHLLGMWTFVPTNGICWEVHTYLLPGHGFHRGREAARAMAEWIWRNTTCRRIFTNVPSFNRIARRFAEAAGMREFGVNCESFLKNGKVYDQVMLGMTRPEGTPPCPQL